MGYRKTFSEKIADHISKKLSDVETDELRAYLADTAMLDEKTCGEIEYGLKEVLIIAIQNQLQRNKEEYHEMIKKYGVK